LEDVYPVVFLDAFVLKIREGGSVQRRACYLAMGVNLDGSRDVLGLWFLGIGGREVLDAGPGAPRGAIESSGGARPPSLVRRSGWV
jgi:hypothetical protein